MPHPHWPLFDLRIRTPWLELRYPDDELVGAVARLAAEGIHPPESMPFSVPWTRRPAGQLERGVLQHHWRRRAELGPDEWHLPFAVLLDGEVVGAQELFAVRFAVRRTVETGSWVGQRFQGRGIGAEMRAAVLHLAFAGLGATRAETSCWADNPASAAVTRKLRYEDDGVELLERDGEAVVMRRFSLSAERWQPRDDVTVVGLGPCLPLLGVGG